MRITAPMMLVAALIAAAALPAAASSAAIGLQDDRLRPEADVPGRINMLKATGTQVTRLDLFWGTAAPTRPANAKDHTDPAYDWSWSDAVLCGLVREGVQPIVSVWNAPGWATGGARGVEVRGTQVAWNSRAPRRAQDFADFMQALATRYNGRTQVADGGACRVNFYEIWNEPNLQIYLYPQYSRKRVASAPKYVQMANRSVPAIKKANPRAVVITGVTGPKGKSDKTGRGTIDWIKDLKRFGLKSGSQYSQHIYPSTPPLSKRKIFPSWNSLGAIAAEVDKLPGGKSKKIYITEASYTTGRTDYRPNVLFTEKQQATYMRDIFRLPIVRSSRVPVVIWFQLQDNPSWPGGILRNAGGAKPSYRTFQALTKSNPPKGNLRP